MVRRLVNGLMYALVVGVATALVSVVPALFIQSVFIGEVELCDRQIRTEQAVYDEVRTTCKEDLDRTPFWFPTVIISGGGAIGVVGGLVYGMLRSSRTEPHRPPRIPRSTPS